MRMYEVHCTYLYRYYFSSNLYLVDSGGQYLDGTTDVTRTFHYGTPSQEQVRNYRRYQKIPLWNTQPARNRLGTTDVTRTFRYGKPSQEQVWNYRHYQNVSLWNTQPGTGQDYRHYQKVPVWNTQPGTGQELQTLLKYSIMERPRQEQVKNYRRYQNVPL